MQVEQSLLRAALHLTVLHAEHDFAVFPSGVILVPGSYHFMVEMQGSLKNFKCCDLGSIQGFL